MTIVYVCLLALTLAGCATPSVKPGASDTEMALKYHQEASELQNEARRLELEAEYYASHQDPDRAIQNLERAREMRIAAAVADDKARSYLAGSRVGGQAGIGY